MTDLQNTLSLKPNQVSELRRLTDQIRETQRLGQGRKLSLALMEKTNKSKQQIYSAASLSRGEVNLSETEVEELVNRNLLKYTSRKDRKLVVTFKTILMSDYGITNLENNVDDMLNDLNKRYFESVMGLSEEPLEAREKAIIIGLLGLGALTDQYALKPCKENEIYIKASVEIAVHFLREFGSEFDDETIDKLWAPNVIGESPVLARMRRLDKIQTHTEGVYRKERNANTHYLDILDREKISESKFAYLLSRIFDKRRLTYDEKVSFMKTLDKIQEYSYKIFRTSPPYDELDVRKQIKRSVESDI